MKFRITRQEYNKRRLTKPLDKVISDTFGPKGGYSFVNQYYVDFKLVDTKGLVHILQKLTIHNSHTSSEEDSLELPTPKTYDRVLYLKELSAYCGVDLAEREIDELILNKKFTLERMEIIRKLRKELSTREHLPNRKQSKILRRLKAQGRHVID